MPANKTPNQYRNAELGRIHAAKKALGIEDEDYRDILEQLCGVRSAADLDSKGRFKVIKHLTSLGYPTRRTYGRKPQVNGDKTALMNKIEALLADSKLPWSYADSIAKRMAKVEKVAWCDAKQLHGIVVALIKRKKR